MKPSKNLTCESACAQTVCVCVCVCVRARSCFCLLDIMKLSKRLTISKAQKVLAFPRDKWDQGSIKQLFYLTTPLTCRANISFKK